jgi:hypothetical protein
MPGTTIDLFVIITRVSYKKGLITFQRSWGLKYFHNFKNY